MTRRPLSLTVATGLMVLRTILAKAVRVTNTPARVRSNSADTSQGCLCIQGLNTHGVPFGCCFVIIDQAIPSREAKNRCR